MRQSIQSMALPGALALAALLGLSQTARADEIQYNYNLAAGASTGPIGIPASNMPVQVMGVQTQPGFRGVGQATMLRVSPTSFLEWVGLDIASNLGSPTVSEGFSAGPGSHVIWLDFSQTVDIEVASATQILIHNAGTAPAKGTITLVW